jgi:hypothetical protein
MLRIFRKSLGWDLRFENTYTREGSPRKTAKKFSNEEGLDVGSTRSKYWNLGRELTKRQ